MQYAYSERLYWYSFYEHSLREGGVVTIFLDFLGKCRSYVLLIELTQKFICFKIEVFKDLVRSCLLYDFKVNLLVTVSNRRICVAFRDSTINEHSASHWFQKFM